MKASAVSSNLPFDTTVFLVVPIQQCLALNKRNRRSCHSRHYHLPLSRRYLETRFDTCFTTFVVDRVQQPSSIRNCCTDLWRKNSRLLSQDCVSYSLRILYFMLMALLEGVGEVESCVDEVTK